jgi:uroporphyrinogen III methyltransferase/synthase
MTPTSITDLTNRKESPVCLPRQSSVKRGSVYLVGAGPGDPGLITRRGAEVLGRAEVVVHDYLAAPELLDLAPATARRIYVGKKGSQHTLSQPEINRLLIGEAQAGHTVVRLKGGDPYIFGRGGEEALELKRAGLYFEVVPGVTSAIAAAACAGVPLTHRDISSQAVLLTGHEKPGKSASSHDWPALAAMGTLSLVMGAENLPRIAQNLIEAGKSARTPSVLIQWGATDRQRTVSGPLGELPEIARRAGLGAPALLVIGQVVSLREELNWFESRPLWGRNILVTRTKAQAGELSGRLRELGARVLEKPTIKIEPLVPSPHSDQVISRLKTFKYLLLTSPNGADLFMGALRAGGLDSRALCGLTIAVIGPGTQRVMTAHGLTADIMPKVYTAEGLAAAMSPLAPGRCLLARAEEARDILPLFLSDLGFEVELLPLYRTTSPALEPDLTETLDLATLTSASTARGLAEGLPLYRRALIPVASIGPITTAAARELGFKVAAEAKTSTIESLVDAVTSYLGK